MRHAFMSVGEAYTNKFHGALLEVMVMRNTRGAPNIYKHFI